MRQKTAIRATWAVAAVIVSAVIAYGCVRSGGGNGGDVHTGEHDHLEHAAPPGEHPEQATAEEHPADEHRTEAEAEHAGHEHVGDTEEAEHPQPEAEAGHGAPEHEEAPVEQPPGHEHAETAPAAGEVAPERPVSGAVIDGVRVVVVKARKFVFDPGTIIVRQGERIRLEVTSEDVTHGIGIKSHGVEEVLLPGKMVKIEFDAGEPGSYHVHCSVFCGDGHDDMHGELIVLQTTD